MLRDFAFNARSWLSKLLRDLRNLWCTKELWLTNPKQACILLVVVGFWLRQTVGVLTDKLPLLGWMISAFISVLIVTFMNVRVFTASTMPGQRENVSIVLLQFIVIIAGNAAVIVIMLVKGSSLTSADGVIAEVVIVAVAAGVAVGVLKSRSSSPVLLLLSPWAQCWCAVSLKTLPQIVQAYWIMTGRGTLDAWSVVFLLAQGYGRFDGAYRSWRWQKEVKTSAVLLTAVLDLCSIVAIAAGVGLRVAL